MLVIKLVPLAKLNIGRGKSEVVGARSSGEKLITTRASACQSAGSVRITWPQGPQRGSTALSPLSVPLGETPSL